MNTVARQKRTLREELKARRSDAARAAPAAGEQLAAHALKLSGACVAAYRPIRAEIDPLPLAMTIAGGGPIALPVTRGPHIFFRAWKPGEPLVRGAFGIEEPLGDEVEPDLVLVPLLGFTRRGERLGYGAGHYDRYLAAHPGVRAVGVAFAAQELTSLPTEPHDVFLEAIATERGIITCGVGR